ncbi:MAG: transposase family protein [Actinobacteria bacterium]|nr:transposase family protein [Actinomycetota bacterium]
MELCAMIHSETTNDKNPWPPILGLFKSVVVALTYMRRNRVQAELAETYGVSQPTISRAVSGVTPLLGEILSAYVPTAEELDVETQYIEGYSAVGVEV